MKFLFPSVLCLPINRYPVNIPRQNTGTEKSRWSARNLFSVSVPETWIPQSQDILRHPCMEEKSGLSPGISVGTNQSMRPLADLPAPAMSNPVKDVEI